MRAYRKLEAEAEEKLQNVYAQLLQAGVDRNENERENKLRETLASLQELFPGMSMSFPVLWVLMMFWEQEFEVGWLICVNPLPRNMRLPSPSCLVGILTLSW